MGLLFVLAVMGIIFGPVIWAVTKGRDRQAPGGEDLLGRTGYERVVQGVQYGQNITVPSGDGSPDIEKGPPGQR